MSPDQRLAFTNSQNRGQVLLEVLEDDITDDERVRLIADNWTCCEAWGEDLPEALGWLENLKMLGYGFGELPDGTEDVLTIYRATGGEEPTAGSWTLSFEVAERFARMIASPRGAFLGIYSDAPVIWTAKVHRSDVLGYFDDRNEQEVVTGDPQEVEKYARLVKQENA